MKHVFAILVFLLLGSTHALHAQAKRPPNIVIILADDMGYGDVEWQGCKDIPTPNLTRLANAGVRCSNGYVSGPYCSPTRAGLLTGRYQTRFGHEFNPGAGPNVGLPLSQTTIANRLRALGYVTGLIGKWHLGAAAKFQPQQRGFDEFYGFLGGAHPYFPGMGAAIYRGATEVKEKEYLTDAFAREAASFLDRNKEKPFFLYLAFNAIHTPMHATEDRLKRFERIQDKTRRTCAAMTVAMDEAVGRVLDKLREIGQEENTLIFFFSDNGGPTMVGTTINGSRNFPLRGSKRTTLEGGIRIPFVVAWKGKLPAGKLYEKPVIQLDILPTALSAAGAPPKAEDKLDGVDLLPFLTGMKKETPHETLYWRLGAQMAIRHGDWSLVRYDTTVDNGKKGGKKKGPAVTGPRLYNLRDDIGQIKDLSAAEPERLRQLQTLWDRWSAEQAQPLWGGGKKKAK